MTNKCLNCNAEYENPQAGAVNYSSWCSEKCRREKLMTIAEPKEEMGFVEIEAQKINLKEGDVLMVTSSVT